MKLTPDEYLQINVSLHALMEVLFDLDVASFVIDASHAEAIGPILDPTAYLAKGHKLNEDIQIATVFLKAKRELLRLTKQEESVE